MYSSLQLLEKKHPELPDNDLWGQVKQDVQDTIVLLNDLSLFNNTGVINPVVLDPAVFLASVAAACRPSIEAQGIRFLFYVPKGLPAVSADPVKLKEALFNLLRNAEDAVNDACPAGYPKQIRLFAESSESLVRFHVRDNGTGILPEYMDTIFDPFVTHKPDGTGLGLGIVKNIAERHGGTVSIQTNASPPATYTDVCVSIPSSTSR